MKKSIVKISIYVAIATLLTTVLLTSCSTARQSGCPNTWQFGGYK